MVKDWFRNSVCSTSWLQFPGLAVAAALGKGSDILKLDRTIFSFDERYPSTTAGRSRGTGSIPGRRDTRARFEQVKPGCRPEFRENSPSKGESRPARTRCAIILSPRWIKSARRLPRRSQGQLLSAFGLAVFSPTTYAKSNVYTLVELK